MNGNRQRPRRPRAGACLLAWLAMSMAAWLSPAQAGEAEGVDAAVRSVWESLDLHWNGRDVEAFAALFAPDADFLFVDRRQALFGQEEIRRHFDAQFPQYAPSLRHHTRIRTVRVVAPGVAVADGDVDILRVATGEGGQPTVLRRFAITAAMLLSGDQWRIGALRVYALPDADAPAAQSGG
jgi:uncharacterized protein (TIGR02246 family)